MQIKNKNILITGAGKRFGRELALKLASLGANIAVHYNKSKEYAEGLTKELNKKDIKSIAVQANILKPKQIAKAVKKTAEGLGTIDILINNAAIFHKTPFNEITDKDWDNFLDINLKGCFYFAKEFMGPPVKPGDDSVRKIINIADTYGASPAKGFLPYGVSKAGVIALTKGLAKELAPNTLVNAICPGPFLPAVNESVESINKATARTLLRRMGSTEDIIKTIVFLIENDYITGQAIFVDGGRHI